MTSPLIPAEYYEFDETEEYEFFDSHVRSSTIDTSLFVPLSKQMIEDAEAFALAQPKARPNKRKQVFCNTLAVYAVENWLQLQDSTASESIFGDSFSRSFEDVAGFEIPNIGKIICYPILELSDDSESCNLSNSGFYSSENWHPDNDCLAHVIVRIPADLKEVELLGWSFEPYLLLESEIQLHRLEPPTDLPERLSIEKKFEAKGDIIVKGLEDMVKGKESITLVMPSQSLDGFIKGSLAAATRGVLGGVSSDTESTSELFKKVLRHKAKSLARRNLNMD